MKKPEALGFVAALFGIFSGRFSGVLSFIVS
jgi:hypothetical protein